MAKPGDSTEADLNTNSATTEDTVADLVSVTFIYDPALGSPVETQPLGGRTVAVPKSAIPLPKRGSLLGQQGFGRQAVVADPTSPETPPATMIRWEWVLQGGTDPVDLFVDNLTGRPGWLIPASRATIKTLVQRLFSAGIPRSTIVNQVPLMYQAVAAEVRAEDSASPKAP